MNPTDLRNFQPSLVSTPYNSQQDNNILVDFPAQTNFFTSDQSYSGQENANMFPAQQNIHVPNQYEPMSMLPQQMYQTSTPTTNYLQNQNQPVRFNKFFYRPDNDIFNYHIECERISDDLILQLLFQPFIIMQLNENNYRCIFFYKQLCNNQFYQISCEIIPPSLINYWLNKRFYGNEIEQNTTQEQLAFTEDQKENLKQHLTFHLSHHRLLY
ncbi:hypothetical protein C1645_851882 [Glomus cerebriforme]|uniref:Uncharacterized protein n=1 Tax=Glomus cerebriforme TaxID=658196 RepID=A0A397TI20_9GLOM|nr:hypothetical protein C1645_851882 [Glomus cerebriforme]